MSICAALSVPLAVRLKPEESATAGLDSPARLAGLSAVAPLWPAMEKAPAWAACRTASAVSPAALVVSESVTTIAVAAPIAPTWATRWPIVSATLSVAPGARAKPGRPDSTCICAAFNVGWPVMLAVAPGRTCSVGSSNWAAMPLKTPEVTTICL